MEPIVDVEVDKSVNLVVGVSVFALFDGIWFRGKIKELRPKNKRDKYFCQFEDGDSRSMNMSSLFDSIPADSKWPAFSPPETHLATEAPNLSVVSDLSLDNTVDARKSINQHTDATGTISINNDLSD